MATGMKKAAMGGAAGLQLLCGHQITLWLHLAAAA